MERLIRPRLKFLFDTLGYISNNNILNTNKYLIKFVKIYIKYNYNIDRRILRAFRKWFTKI